jgi:hypothetical protein
LPSIRACFCKKRRLKSGYHWPEQSISQINPQQTQSIQNLIIKFYWIREFITEDITKLRNCRTYWQINAIKVQKEETVNWRIR